MSEAEKMKPEGAPEPERQIHDAALDWFLALQDGEVSKDLQDQFDEWRITDSRHDAAYREVVQSWSRSEDLREVFQDTHVTPTPDRQVDAHPYWPPLPAKQRPQRRLPWRMGAIAATIAAATLALPEAMLRLEADYLTATGEVTSIALNDQSRVWLDTKTALAVDFSQPRRDLSLLRGAAIFEVAHDAERPFAVKVGQAEIRALGTVFAVHEAGDASLLVQVTEGSVEVISTIDGAQTNRQVIEAGLQLRLTRAGTFGEFEPVRGNDWAQGFIAIRDLGLKDALDEIARYHPGQILLISDAPSDLKVNARIPINDIASGLSALSAAHGLGVTWVTPYLLIIS
ncbi:MAG: FecR domain-containing protein [Pseudomonadota bacterium]